jgi:type I site-specific restriction endonuclease
MRNKYCNRAAVDNESDVEQKLIYPFLKDLGYSDIEIKTKNSIDGHFIGKGATRKKHFPDYIVYNGDKPLLIVEAQNPIERIEEFMHEPQDYSAVINRKYIGFNPVKYCLISNGEFTYLLNVDEEEPIIRN